MCFEWMTNELCKIMSLYQYDGQYLNSDVIKVLPIYNIYIYIRFNKMVSHKNNKKPILTRLLKKDLAGWCVLIYTSVRKYSHFLKKKIEADLSATCLSV